MGYPYFWKHPFLNDKKGFPENWKKCVNSREEIHHLLEGVKDVLYCFWFRWSLNQRRKKPMTFNVRSATQHAAVSPFAWRTGQEINIYIRTGHGTRELQCPNGLFPKDWPETVESEAIAILYHSILDQSFFICFNSWNQECNVGKIWPENNNCANLVIQSELNIT